MTLGSCLFEAGRHEEAIDACEKAIRWNPADPGLRFKLGENYKRLHDMEAYGRVLRELFPYIATADELAHYHRAMGYLGVERGNLKVAADHQMVSLFFDKSQYPLSEVMFIKMQYGEDYTDMTLQDALRVLEEAGEEVFPDEDTYHALNQLLGESFRHGDYETTLQTAIELYNFMHGEEYEKLARQLMEAMRGAAEDDQGDASQLASVLDMSSWMADQGQSAGHHRGNGRLRGGHLSLGVITAKRIVRPCHTRELT